nr:Rrf2 family transcriptional regulator [uncultured Pedobacter sp.]
MNNGRFAISLHILTLLCKSKGELLSSDYIAGSININPVLVRKEIIQLRKAGYVDSKEGKNGGCFLSKKADEISLADLFKMVYQNPVLSLAKNRPNPNCPIGKAINANLNELYEEVEEAMLAKLAKSTLADFCLKFD